MATIVLRYDATRPLCSSAKALNFAVTDAAGLSEVTSTRPSLRSTVSTVPSEMNLPFGPPTLISPRTALFTGISSLNAALRSWTVVSIIPGTVTVISSGTSAPENFPFNVVVVETDVQATAAMAKSEPMIYFFILSKFICLSGGTFRLLGNCKNNE